MLRLASSLRIPIIVLFNMAMHVVLKVLSVFVVGMLISTSDRGMRNVKYLESVFVVLHLAIIFIMLQKKFVIKNAKEFFIVVFFSAVLIVGLYYFKYLPPFGAG